MFSYVVNIILVIVLVYMGTIYNSAAVIMLGFSGALFVVLSFIYLMIRRRRITGSISIPIVLAEKGRPSRINIDIYNSSKITAHKLRVQVAYGDRNTGKLIKKWIWIHGARPGKKSFSNQVIMNRPGSYYFQIRKLRIYDVTGLFYVTRKLEIGDSAMILPEIKPVSVKQSEAVKNFFGDADTYDELRGGYDPSETFDIRDYRPGDKMQSVHWKLSAKTGDLVVRENSLPKACPVVLILDPEGCNQKNKDKFYELAASLSFSMMDDKCPHYVSWRSAGRNDVVRTRVDDEESYFFFLTQFMADNLPNVDEDYSEKYRRDVILHKVILYGDGLLEIDGESQGYPDFDNFELVL